MNRIVLSVSEGPAIGQEFEFTEHDIFLFGRSMECHVRIPNDGYLSRHHFLLEFNPPDVTARDLGSLNGTFVNGKKIGSRNLFETPAEGAKKVFPTIPLCNGDQITVGRTKIIIRILTDKNLHKIACLGCGTPILLKQSVITDAKMYCDHCLQELLLKPENLENHSKLFLNNEYQLIKKLGSGGMGEVFLVRDIVTNKEFALKMLLSKSAVDKHAKEQFLREVGTLSKLKQPNIIEFIKVASVGNVFYFIMEYCNQGSALDYITKNNNCFSVDDSIKYLLQILDGLTYAHSKGFVHRDIKPSNILFTRTNSQTIAKLSDFGLSKNFTHAGFSGMTITGNYAGSYPFMPREQITNFKYVKPTSDVWSLGATFYYMMTGFFPLDFSRGHDPLEIILSQDAVPIRDRKSSIPKRIAEVIDKSLKTKPKDRFVDAAEMKKRLLTAL